MREALLIKYGEIAMRGKNRYLIENKLVEIIKKGISGIGNYYVSKEQGRIIVQCSSSDEHLDFDRLIDAVKNIAGVTAVCPGVKLDDKELESIRQGALQFFKTHYPNGGISFKVETKRSDKKYPYNSQVISADIGEYLLDNFHESIRVDVHKPDVLLHIEIRNYAYIYTDIIKAVGGLPLGLSGRAAVLLSGGIDSPVAAFLTLRRGIEISAVYFDSPPYTSERAKQKVKDLADRLAVYAGSIKLYIVPFTDVQLMIYDHTPPEKTTILLKRAMLKTAEKIALSEGSLALVTGDSLGQVASQTLHAIHAIDSAAAMPVLRPLCAMDKQDIVDIARKIETFDISIRPYEDCCTIFVAKHPETKPKKNIIESIESKIDGLDEAISKAVSSTDIYNA